MTTPRLQAEVLAQNLITRNDHPQRLLRILMRLERLLEAADKLKQKAEQVGVQ